MNRVSSNQQKHFYRFTFQGMESDDEIKGGGNSHDFGARMYDARVGRFLTLDAYAGKFPRNSGYIFASNMPISCMDINGDSTFLIIYGSGQLATGYTEGSLKNSPYKSALARQTAIENSKDFDKAADRVVIVYCPTEESIVNAINDTYPSGEIEQIDVYSHGTNNSLNMGGPEIPGAVYPQDDSQDKRMLSAQDISRDADVKYENELDNINVSFSPEVRIFLWACYTGGYKFEGDTDVQAQNASFAQALANVTGGTVYASFNSGMQYKTSGGKNVYDGTMIRDKDVKSQKTMLTKFKPNNVATETSPNETIEGGGM